MRHLPFTGLASAERARFIYTLVGFMCVASAALVARAIGDALFLSHYSLDLLSYMYIGTAVVVISASYTYGSFAGRVPIGRLIVRTCSLLIVLLIALRFALMTPWGGFRIVAYLLSDLVVNLPMMLFWSFAALIFNPREAKQSFGFIGAGGTTACILAGFLVQPLAAHLGTSNLLFLVGLLLGGFLLVVARLSKTESARLQTTQTSGSRAAAAGNRASLIKNSQIRNLVLLVLVATVALTLVDYQFKAGARLNYQGAALAGFFGNFYAYASVIALLIQLFCVHRILKTGGVILGLAILPAGLLMASVGTAIMASFSWMVAAKFIVQIFLFTIDIAALQMLYMGIPAQSRNQARTFVEGIGKPLAIAVTGVALAGLSGIFPLHILAVGAAVGAGLWLLLAKRNHTSYVTALVGSLGSRRFDPSQETAQFQDKAFETHLRGSLTSSSDEEIVYLLDLVGEMDHIDWTPEFRTLLKRASSPVKIAALQYLQKMGVENDLTIVLAHRDHTDPEVRAAAIYAASALGKEDTVEDIEKNLQDPHSMVRAAAIATLINSGDLENLLNAGVVLKEMLASSKTEDRLASAEALAHIQNEGLVRPLVGLLLDSDTAVVKAALDACKKRADPQLMPAVIPLLADPPVAAATAETLASFGPPVLDHLIPYLELHRAEGAFPGADRVPPILARIGDFRALPALLDACLQTTRLDIQEQALKAYCRLLRTAPSLKPYLKDLNGLIVQELEIAQKNRKTLLEIDGFPGTEILHDALQQEYRHKLRNTFDLLDIIIPDVDMHAIYRSLNTQNRESRANALEVLDNLLKGDIKTALLGLLETSIPPASGSKNAAKTLIAILETGAADWVLIGALYAVEANHLEGARPYLRQYMEHSNAQVRETALFALAALESRETLAETCIELAQDPNQAVSRLAKELSKAP